MSWFLFVTAAAASELVVQPYVQNATPEGFRVMWELDTPEDAEVVIGGGVGEQRIQGVLVASEETAWIYVAEVPVDDPGSAVTYAVEGGDWRTPDATVRVPPGPGWEGTFGVVAVSDMQRSSRDPDKWREVVEDGILARIGSTPGTDPAGEAVADAFAMMLLPGDLVDDGPDKAQWTEQFFGPVSRFARNVPLYPVPGNHERGTHWFFDYFDLPTDAGAGREEQWWSVQYADLLVLGMDSNAVVAWPEQLAFVDAQLERACTDDSIDFVFAQAHHPFESELWTPGNAFYVGNLIERLEDFASLCGKPTIYFFGHTHAYARGQSSDHRHLTVGVASAGGALDYWGEQAQRNYPEFSVTDDAWGFVTLEVTSGADPRFTLQRWSRGDNVEALDNVLIDEIEVRRFDAPPAAPEPLPKSGIAAGACFTLSAGPFHDADGQGHQASQWQVATSCDGFDLPVVDAWVQDQDRYFDRDVREQTSLTELVLRAAVPEGDACWRVRYRDTGLSWGAWSVPATLVVQPSSRSGNLIEDPGAEADGEGWDLTGDVAAVADGQCGVDVAVGAHAYALGAGCGPAGAPSMVREVARPEELGGVVGSHVLHLGLLARAGNVDVRLEQVDTEGAVLATFERAFNAAGDWEALSEEVVLDAGMARAVLTLSAQGAVHLDEVELSVGDPGPLDCPIPTAVAVDSAPSSEESGCGAGCTTVADGAASPRWLALLLLGVALSWRRRTDPG